MRIGGRRQVGVLVAVIAATCVALLNTDLVHRVGSSRSIARAPTEPPKRESTAVGVVAAVRDREQQPEQTPTRHPDGGWVIQCAVEDARGRKVDHGTLIAIQVDEGRRIETGVELDGDGVLRLDAIPIVGGRITCGTRSYAIHSGFPPIPTRIEEGSKWSICIPAPLRLRGIVSDVESGRPVRDVPVAAKETCPWAMVKVSGQARSAADGRFEIECAGWSSIEVAALPRRTAMGAPSVSSTEEVDKIVEATTDRVGLAADAPSTQRHVGPVEVGADYWPIEEPHVVTVDAATADALDVGTILVGRSGTVNVLVVDRDERPVSGVTLMIECPVRGIILVPDATGSGGRTSLPYPPIAATVWFRAVAPYDVASGMRELRVAPARECEVRLVVSTVPGTTEGGPCTLRVVDGADNPIEGASVQWGEVERETGSDGTVEFEALDGPVAADLRVRHPQYREEHRPRFKPAGRFESVVLEPKSAARILVTCQGQRVEQIRLAPVREALLPWTRRRGIVVRGALREFRSESGTYELPASISLGKVVIVAPQRGAGVFDLDHRPETAADEPLECKLTEAQSFTGTVIDDRGNPASGAIVVSALRSIGIDVTHGSWDRGQSIDVAQADAHGRFEIRGLASGSLVGVFGIGGSGVVVEDVSAAALAVVRLPAPFHLKLARVARRSAGRVQVTLKNRPAFFQDARPWPSEVATLDVSVPLAGTYEVRLEDADGTMQVEAVAPNDGQVFQLK